MGVSPLPGVNLCGSLQSTFQRMAMSANTPTTSAMGMTREPDGAAVVLTTASVGAYSVSLGSETGVASGLRVGTGFNFAPETALSFPQRLPTCD
jgi:hypothetical protein